MKINIVKPSFTIEPTFTFQDMINREPYLIPFMLSKLRSVEYYARVSHRSEDKQSDTSWKRFIESVVLQHGDWSVTEHEKVTVEIITDRGITHELVRHRIGSYTQESTRFVNYEKKGEINVICPFTVNIEDRVYIAWKHAIGEAAREYQYLLNEGVTPQLARSVLPNALASKIVITYNLRNWRHFFIMRCTKESHPQMREVTIPLLKEFQRLIPLLYDDIIPDSRQAEMIRLPK